jgi:hypothetical protein
MPVVAVQPAPGGLGNQPVPAGRQETNNTIARIPELPRYDGRYGVNTAQ